jgi:hypothetical protein
MHPLSHREWISKHFENIFIELRELYYLILILFFGFWFFHKLSTNSQIELMRSLNTKSVGTGETDMKLIAFQKWLCDGYYGLW